MNTNQISNMVKPLINLPDARQAPAASRDPDITEMLQFLTLLLKAESVEKRFAPALPVLAAAAPPVAPPVAAPVAAPGAAGVLAQHPVIVRLAVEARNYPNTTMVVLDALYHDDPAAHALIFQNLHEWHQMLTSAVQPVVAPVAVPVVPPVAPPVGVPVVALVGANKVALPLEDYIAAGRGTAVEWAKQEFARPNYDYINNITQSLQNVIEKIKK